MDIRAADTIVGYIAGCHRGYWPAATREAWAEAIQTTMHNAEVADQAAKVLAVRWDGEREPSFGAYKAIYDGMLRRQEEERQRGLPSGHKRMALIDYLLGLAGLAEDGDRAARNEIESWRKFLRGDLATALPGVEDARAWFASNPDALWKGDS